MKAAQISVIALLMAAFACASHAAEEAHPELPTAAQVSRILLAAPQVRAADALLRADQSEARRLEAGPHEWNLSVGRQRREVRTQPETQRFAEWEASIQRSLRLPGKAELDGRLGQAAVEIGRSSRGEALHETSRQLLAGWFQWLRQDATLRQWEEQTALLEKQANALSRRRQLGDASRIEAVQAEAALAQARAQRRQAQAHAEAAAVDLTQRFPGLPLPALPSDVAPEPLAGAPDTWVEAVLKQDHELGVARAEAQRARLLAQRVDREQRPDPTLGVRMASERGGEERVAGLVLSIALPGGQRAAHAEAELARADAAAQRETAVLQRVRAAAAAQVAQAGGAFEAWQASQEAATRLLAAAEMAARAYALGEGSLADSLAARRLAGEAQLAARLARLDALEQRDRLLLDAHLLWDPEDDEPTRAAVADAGSR